MDKLVLKTIADIKSLKIQGARNIAIAALDALNHVAQKNGFGKEFVEAANALELSRKTAVPLYNAMEIVKKEKNIETIKEIKQFFQTSMKKTAENGAKLIKNGSTILTHCHSSEAIQAMILAKRKGKKISVIVTETRPKLQGIKTAKELLAAKIPVEFIVDDAVEVYFSAEPKKPRASKAKRKDIKDIDLAIFGCDSIRKEGVYNKIGTDMMALLCHENKIPVYFIGDSFKIDRRKSIEIEMRPKEEIISPKKLKGAKILNPAFDCTQWKLVSGVVTERGVFRKWNELNS